MQYPPFFHTMLTPFSLLDSMADERPLTVDNTMGASLIGVICAAILYGVSCIQTWYYFDKYTKDVWYIKTLVGNIWLFDTIHQGLISHTVYTYVVTNYNNPDKLNNMVWSILLEVLFNALIGLLVQGFLTLRVWRLSGHNVPLIILTVGLVSAEFGCSLAFTIQSMKLVTWVQLTQLKGLSMAVNILAAATDVIIAGALCFFLHQSRTGFRRSDTMISKLIMFSVSTGVLTSICAIASLVSIIAWGNNLIYVAFYFSLGRLYSNSALATLNARQAIRELGEDCDDMTFSIKMRPASSKSSGQRLDPNRATNISIKIDTSQRRDRDLTCSDDEPQPEFVATENPYEVKGV